MSYTKQHAAENAELYRVAIDALHEVGWMPEPEPRNWQVLATLAHAELANGFPDVPYKRIHHQVHKVMAEYRGRKKAEWKE